jgi:hypothetical protein
MLIFPLQGHLSGVMKLLKQQTGLNFKWQGATPIKVEKSTSKLKRIDATETPSDARRGLVPETEKLANPNNPLGFFLAG